MYGRYRHYGSSEFNLSSFEPISNRQYFVKPIGGLWAEPLNPKPSSRGWKDWCEENDFNTDRINEWFDFDLVDSTKVFRIVTENDIYRLNRIRCCGFIHHEDSTIFDMEVRWINFKRLMDLGYDAVEFEINDFTYWALYGWDCDSIVVINPDKIIPVIDEDIEF